MLCLFWSHVFQMKLQLKLNVSTTHTMWVQLTLLNTDHKDEVGHALIPYMRACPFLAYVHCKWWFFVNSLSPGCFNRFLNQALWLTFHRNWYNTFFSLYPRYWTKTLTYQFLHSISKLYEKLKIKLVKLIKERLITDVITHDFFDKMILF